MTTPASKDAAAVWDGMSQDERLLLAKKYWPGLVADCQELVRSIRLSHCPWNGLLSAERRAITRLLAERENGKGDRP